MFLLTDMVALIRIAEPMKQVTASDDSNKHGDGANLVGLKCDVECDLRC